MKERGMIFNAEMVRELLNGNKTQTRRPLNLNNHAGWRVEQNEYGTALRGRITCPHPKKDRFGVFVQRDSVNGRIETDLIPCPFGQVGDRIYVRETFAITTNVNAQDDWPGRPNKIIDDGQCVIWRADGGWNWCDDDGFDTEKSYWKPSIHMPRWASRITLEITGVRVERLQDMTQQDAIAEGVENLSGSLWRNYQNNIIPHEFFAKDSYQTLWQSIYGNWNENPWVWAIEFKVLK